MRCKKKLSAADRAFLNGFMLGHLIGEAAAAQERVQKYERFAEDLLARADKAINAARREIGLPELPSPIGQANPTMQ